MVRLDNLLDLNHFTYGIHQQQRFDMNTFTSIKFFFIS